MEQFLKNDYIEHWENGVGKVANVDDETISVDFKLYGNIIQPIEKCESYKKLDPKGLLAQLYKNEDYIYSLIGQESTEIIKLLIYDENESQNRKIERSRIKPLLTKGTPTERGWRKDFGLIDDERWDKWWKTVDKKLSEDVWFDTSSKLVIVLRKKPVSPAQNMFEQFSHEKQKKKKLLICEPLIKAITKDDDQSILENIVEFIAEIFTSKSQTDLIHLAVVNAIQLSEKETDVEPFMERSHELLLDTLLMSKLPNPKIRTAYSYFSKLQYQNITDHLVIFLLRDKIRKAIGTNFKKNKAIKKQIESYVCEESVTDKHIIAINSLKSKKEGFLKEGLTDLVELIDNNCAASFFNYILLYEKIENETKEVVSKVVMEFKLTAVIYAYLNNVQLTKIIEILFLPEFLDFIGSQNAELSLRQNLLNEKTAKERPNVFLSALKSLAANSFQGIDDSQKQSLITHTSDLLSNKLIGEQYDNLKLHISNILVGNSKFDKLTGVVQIAELVNLAGERSISPNKRFDALKVLIKKGLKKECQSIASKLIRGLDVDDLILIEKVFTSFPDNLFAKDLLVKIVESIDSSDKKLHNATADLLIKAKLDDVFLKSIFLDKDDAWHDSYREIVSNVLVNEYLAKNSARFALEKIMLNPEQPSTILDRFSFYCSPFIRWTLEEARNICIDNLRKHETEVKEIENDLLKKIEQISKEKDEQLIDAIDRTNQRYEEYLKRLVPNLSELEEVKDRIKKDFDIEKYSSSQKELFDKVAMIKENIEGLLKLLEIIDRD